MISQLLTLWQKKNQLDFEDDYVYGVFNEIGFSINDETGGKLLVISAIASSNNSYKKMQELCKMMGGCFSYIKVGKVEEYLALFIDESSYMLTVSDLDSIIQFVASNYASAGFNAHTTCYKCGQPSSKLVFKDQLVRPVCKNCAHQPTGGFTPERVQPIPVTPATSDFEKDFGAQNFSFDDNNFSQSTPKREEEKFSVKMNYDDDYSDSYSDDRYSSRHSHMPSGSLFGGLLGSFLGAIVGVIPFLLLFSVTASHVSLAVLCLLAPLFAVFAYKMFKGRDMMSTATICVALTCLAVSAVAVLWVQLATSLLDAGATSTSISYVFSNLSQAFSGMAIKDLLIQELIALIAVVLGTILFKRILADYCDE